MKLTFAEREILERLATGDRIAFSQDGEQAWFTGGDRGFADGDAVVSIRGNGLTKRITLDEENYRGMSERDVISTAGRAALEAINDPSK